jgi:hypothetical protein
MFGHPPLSGVNHLWYIIIIDSGNPVHSQLRNLIFIDFGEAVMILWSFQISLLQLCPLPFWLTKQLQS